MSLLTRRASSGESLAEGTKYELHMNIDGLYYMDHL